MKLQAILICAALATSSAWAQSIIAAKSGLIHDVDGVVMLGETVLKPQATEFPMAGEGELLRVGEGHAEILLTPGAVLRLGRDSAARLLSTRLDNTRIALLAGPALVEIDALLDDNSISVVANGGAEVRLLKHGLYYFNADTGQFRVYDGKAEAARDGELASLKKGRTVQLTDALDVAKFDRDQKDDLYYWSDYRSRIMAIANQGAAQSLGSRASLQSNVWYWNRSASMYTFLPASGTLSNPFGYRWYSPGTVWIVYTPPLNTGFANASNGAGNSWGGISTTSSGAQASSVAASPGIVVRSSAPAAAAASAPVAAPSGGRSR